MSSLKHLFGGAIIVELPDDLVDASTVRQVPDTQEVFFSPSADVSYVIEILQRAEPDDLEDAAKFHFDSLAHDNEAICSEVSNVAVPEDVSSPLAGTPSPILLHGSQKVAKFNRQAADDVRIFLAVYRITSKGVDLVFSANIPMEKETGDDLGEMDINNATNAFLVAARTLKIVDFDLFA